MDFPRRTHHICLVSEQTLPNYLGAIVHDAFPKKVHLVVTSRMKERADILEKALQRRGRDVEQYGLAAPQPAAVMEVLEKIYGNTGPDMAVNVTGGTKIMALTAVEWASLYDKDARPFLFYVDTDSRKILQIGGRMEQYEMTTALSVGDILGAGAGHKIIENKNEPLKKQKRDAVDALLRIFLKNTDALKLFNACAAEGKKSFGRARLPFKSPTEFSEAVRIACQLRMLDVVSDEIHYTSEEDLQWCNGGWLEDYVKKTLYQLKCCKIIDDWGANVRIDYRTPISQVSKNDPCNELDGVFTVKNRLFIIECKSCDMQENQKTKSVQSNAEKAIYKLDSLKKTLGGALSRGMIVCVHKPRSTDIQRCKDLRIELLYGTEVRKLEEKLKSWIENAHR